MEEHTKQQQTWWQKNKKLLMRIVLIALLVVVIVMIILIFLGYIFNWDWTGINATNFTSTPQKTTRIIVYQPGKTLWDWLGLLGVLAIPVVVGLFTFQQGRASDESRQQQKETELEIATDNQREAALQAYIDKISELLLHEKLREPSKDDELRKIARVRTLTTISSLDDIRKGRLIKFLWDSDLINNGEDSIIYLYDADLSGANLSNTNLDGSYLGGANLSGANLSGTFLVGANLVGANLREANLHNADLTSGQLGKSMQVIPRLDKDKQTVIERLVTKITNLHKADLSEAILSDTDLSEADLSDANFEKANLRGAIVNDQQLSKAKSLKGATMPDGSIHP